MMGDILFFAHRIPYPPDRGDKIRSYNILKKLCELATVHVATFADHDEDLGHAETLRPMLGSLHVEKRTVSKPVGGVRAILSGKPISLTLFDRPGIRDFVSRTMETESIDTVFVFSGQMAQFVPELPPGICFIMDFGDVDSAKFASYAESSSIPMRYVHAREARKLAAFERETAQRADASLFVSEAEAALFRSEAGLDADRVRALENGIDCTFFDPDAAFPAIERPAGPLVVFTGQMDYRPNVEAAVSFADDVLPIIRLQNPHITFAVVGRNPTGEVERLAGRDGVIVTGGVADIRSWLAAADVVVAPLRIARGIQNKVLEAMGMARPVIASRPAFEGIDAVPGRDLLVADTPAEEAQLVLELLSNSAMGEVMGRAARKRMLERYAWDETLAPLAALTGRDGLADPKDALAEVR
ncbi:TIGR03087 family PEP-CTERM/XrtA system glycosyltransferase [Parasphingopyxis algicola]|uniref:TIGR03087 family PEP-CTERM/XrtA system glycosyltransferase n=1 Tax=Parasphingopyxis algicola TaxID=2026624 RepID=UPI0015A159FD|nr:TIGR03087 family PEP-CTERM/XrtA system glycosyltransferase [Parasphingopyxis algicola]QLC24098.1 TIGR03087 family PEP-CTERM/XrtA system glycosyltransferase [Parasphingopyxis algicola]